MRLWFFVLLEAAAVASAGVVVVAGARRLGAGFQSAGASTLRSTVVLPVEEEPLEPATLDPALFASDATGTFLGMKDELLLDRMRTAEIVKAKLNKGGSSISFRLDFADGSRAAFKPEQINPQTVPRKEIAAYRINRMLGLNVDCTGVAIRTPAGPHRHHGRISAAGRTPRSAASCCRAPPRPNRNTTATEVEGLVSAPDAAST